jgi:hypothetical protein
LVFIESEIGPKHVSANYKNKIKMPWKIVSKYIFFY